MAQGDDGRKQGLSHDELMRVLQYIDTNLAEPLLCDRLAEALSMNRSRFDRLFKNSVGQTPYAFILTRRVGRARELLAWSDQPVDEVGLQVGFGRHSNFSTVFRRLTGLTPTRFRVAKRMARNTNRAPAEYLERFGGDIPRSSGDPGE